MNAQEIFDTVKSHLLTQGRKSERGDGACMYRGPNGLKCAIGCLIPDEIYKPEMENKGVWALIDDFTVPSYFSGNDELLIDLQNAHDDCFENFDTLKTRLKMIAKEHVLDYKD